MSTDPLNDIAFSQLMASRLCHDLVGPLGAVSAGLEMAGEAAADGGIDSEALALAAKSAAQMTRKVTFLRVAFGAGTGTGHDPLGEAADLTRKLLADGPVLLDWGVDHAAFASSPQAGTLAKLALNMVLIGAEALARGGRLAVTCEAPPGGAVLSVVAEGNRVVLKDELAQILSADTSQNMGHYEDLTGISARAIQGVYCARLAHALGGGLELSLDQARLGLVAGPLSLTS